MAEVIKYGVIWDENLFTDLERAKNIDSFEERIIKHFNSFLPS